MPNSEASMRSASESASRAYLVAWYQPPMKLTRRPPMELVLMMVPERRARMWGMTALISVATPRTLTSNCRRASSMSTSSTAP